MRNARTAFAAALGLPLLLAQPQWLLAAEPLVLLNGNVYTAAEALPRAQAVIAVDGRIEFVGDSAEALRRAPQGARHIDLRGLTVLPGLTDSHAHLAGIGFRELSFNLEGTSSVADLQARLRERATQQPSAGWIVGRGWIESRWTPAAFPTRADLDAVAADRPVLLGRADGHAAVANSAALRIAGIDGSTPDPSGGQILKDATGEPTGMLIDNAIELVQRHVPVPSRAEVMTALETGASRSVRLGWTQVQIAGTTLEELEILCELYSAGRIKLRLYGAIGGPGPDADRLLNGRVSPDDCSDRLTVRSIKLYMDGALGSRGAALIDPYADAPDTRGLLLSEERTLLPVMTAALRNGVQIQTHAIGDRGNRIVLDLYERVFASVPRQERAVAEPRWRIEHAQVLAPEDISRFAPLGVIASMQPSHAISDLFFAPDRLGAERLAGAYAWRALLDAGATIAAGSDAPVEAGDPLIEFYAAVARRSLDGFADENWRLEQRVSREQALKMQSIWPAHAAFQEQERGSIEVGKLADFSVFSADIMQVPEAEILEARAVMTVIEGEIAYTAPVSGSPTAQ